MANNQPDKDRAHDRLDCLALTLVRGGRLVQADLNFTMSSGEVVLLKGPNGVGKSTLIRALAGLVQPRGGEIQRRGEPVKADIALHQQDLTYIAHQDAVKPAFSVAENLSSWARRPDRIEEALDIFQLTALADVSARLLSAGQKRRLGLARLIVEDANLWLLDEPAVSLDVASVGRLAALIERHRQQGGMVIAATHGDILPDNARDIYLERPDEGLADAWSEVSWT